MVLYFGTFGIRQLHQPPFTRFLATTLTTERWWVIDFFFNCFVFFFIICGKDGKKISQSHFRVKCSRTAENRTKLMGCNNPLVRKGLSFIDLKVSKKKCYPAWQNQTCLSKIENGERVK